MKSINLYAAIILVAAPFGALAQAQDTSIKIIDRTEQRAPVIIIRSKFDFERDISLKVKNNPNMGKVNILTKIISKNVMRDANGVRIRSGFDIDPENNLVVAYSGGNAEIIKTARIGNKLQVISSFKDTNGKFVAAPLDKVAIYSTNGEKLCFDRVTTKQAAPKMSIAILLDRSGSM